MPGNLDFKCALVTGGGGGIGKAMAQFFISQGKKVIIAGRTESKLKDAAKELGSECAYYVLDTGDIPSIEAFAKRLIQEHPDIDCLVNNAGVQRPLDVNDFDLDKADNEININIRGPVHLAARLLDHFKTKKSAVIINVSSVLGFCPFSIINPVYNGTKAFTHFWTMNLRTQLKDSNIRVVELWHGIIQLRQALLHLSRDRDDPDDNKKEKNDSALSLQEFMDFFTKGMRSDHETIGAGMATEVITRWSVLGGDDLESSLFEGMTLLEKRTRSLQQPTSLEDGEGWKLEL
ncbi:hypothetical protein EMMF5_005033 [Cystobasidiomycetes sp. EMM_F5]